MSLLLPLRSCRVPPKAVYRGTREVEWPSRLAIKASRYNHCAITRRERWRAIRRFLRELSAAGFRIPDSRNTVAMFPDTTSVMSVNEQSGVDANMAEDNKITAAADRIIELDKELETAGHAALDAPTVVRAREGRMTWIDDLKGGVLHPALGRSPVIDQHRWSLSIPSARLVYPPHPPG